MAASVVDYSIVAQPNRSLSREAMFGVVAALALPPFLIACAFSLAGAWLVLPFAGLELLLLAGAFRYIHRCAHDYESITVSDQRLAVEQHHLDRTRQVVFHPYWTQVVLHSIPGGEHSLWLRSHGQEVEIGHYMNNEQRLILAYQLKIRTGSVNSLRN